MKYYSQAWQDEFVNNLLNFKRDGFFIDIGSTDGMNQSNSYFFESQMSWKGICVERGIGYAEHYKNNRTCVFLNEDALEINYKNIFEINSFPTRIDYLSVDVDESSANALRKLPLNDYRFSVITIEHDAYRFGDSLRDDERNILKNHNYVILFKDVLVPLGCGMGPNLPFEDWWIDQSVFQEKVMNLSAEKMYPDDIVAMLKSKHEIYVR